MTDTIARVHAGVPTGGQFAATDRADAEATLSAPSRATEVLAGLRDGTISTLVEDGEDRLLRPADIGVPRRDIPSIDEVRIQAVLFDQKFMDGLWEQEPVEVPVNAIAISQDFLVAEVLAFYLEAGRDDDSWDSSIGMYGTELPVLGKLDDGTFVVLDGSHRFARAHLRGDSTLAAHVIG